MNAESRPTRFGPWRREAIAFVELFALTGIAVAQPTFDLIGKNASELVANGRTRSQIVVMTILVLLVPAALAWIAEVAVGFVAPRLRRYAHAAIAAIIIGTFAVEALKRLTGWGPGLLLTFGVLLGIAGGLVLFQFEVARTFVHYLAIAPVAFAILFVVSSPVSTVLFPSDPAAANVKVGNPARVVMIVMDELPLESLLDGSGHVDAELFPNFARLAGDSSWYRNTTTVSPYTETAMPAMLTGDLPVDATALPVASEHPNNLFTLLGDSYEMNVHETMTQLCPASLCTPRAQAGRPGFRGFLRDTATLWGDFASPVRQPDQEVTKVFDLEHVGTAQRAGPAFIRSLKPASEPRLDYLHVLLPHQGWHYLDTGQDNGSAFESGQALNEQGKPVWPTGWLASVGRQKHLLQLQYTDRLLGRMLKKLERIGAYNSSLVVVTADHGVAFSGSEPVRGVSAENYPEVMWTPLFVKAPGKSAGLISDQPVVSIDVLPTIADLLDVNLPWNVDGRSALGSTRTPGDVQILEWNQSTLVPPPGKQYNALDGASGFAKVLQGSASAAGGDPKLRLYRLGTYGALVGTEASRFPQTTTAGPSASVADMSKFDDVDPTARFVPWTWIGGTVAGVSPGRSIAITVNGVTAGISEVSAENGTSTFWASLPPQLFRAGANQVEVYLIEGDPDSPLFTPIRITD